MRILPSSSRTIRLKPNRTQGGCVLLSVYVYRCVYPWTWLLSSILLADSSLAVGGFCKPAVWQDVAIFLASQIFIINNATSYDSKSAASASLGVGEFELFDVFEMRRHGFWARNEAKIRKLYMNIGLKKIICTYMIHCSQMFQHSNWCQTKRILWL